MSWCGGIRRRRADPTTAESWHTALHAAYFLGEQGNEVFAWAAGSRNAELRKTVAYTLYLLWRNDAPYVGDLLLELAGQIRSLPVGRSARLLRTVADTSITIYINHPDAPGVARQTSELWSLILKDRLRLDRRWWLDAIAFGLLASVLSRRVLETALLDQEPALFFEAPSELRQRFQRTIPYVAPGRDLTSAQVRGDLAALLASPVHLHSVLAALVLAVQAASDVASAEPVVRDLFDHASGPARMWIVQAFSVLVEGTPPSWVSLLEELTGRLVEENRDTMLAQRSGWDAEMDLALLPLGLAYGQQRRGMPLLAGLVERSLAAEDGPMATRILEGLTVVGMHYPEQVFLALRPAMRAAERDAAVRGALVRTLAGIRAVRFDQVDVFLREEGADEALRSAVSANTDAGGVHRIFTWVGIYNNAVHQALRYPIMRDRVLLRGLRELAEARTARQFVRSYTWPLLRLLRSSDYELLRWTESGARPEEQWKAMP